MKRTFSFILAVMMVLCFVPASLLTALANGVGAAKDITPNLSLDAADHKSTWLPAEIDVDGKVKDTGWLRDKWSEVSNATGTWNVITPAHGDLNYEYQVQRDHQYIYGAYVVDMQSVANLLDSGKFAEFTLWLNDKTSSQWTQKIVVNVIKSGDDYTTEMTRYYNNNGTAVEVSEEKVYNYYTGWVSSDSDYYPDFYNGTEWYTKSTAEKPLAEAVRVVEEDKINGGILSDKLVVEFRTLLDVFSDQKQWDAIDGDPQNEVVLDANPLSEEPIITNITSVSIASSKKATAISEGLYYPVLSSNADREILTPNVIWPENAMEITGADIANNDGTADYNNVIPSGMDVDGVLSEGVWTDITDYSQYGWADGAKTDDYRTEGTYTGAYLDAFDNLWYQDSQWGLKDTTVDYSGSTDGSSYKAATNTDAVRFKYDVGVDNTYFYGSMLIYSDEAACDERNYGTVEIYKVKGVSSSDPLVIRKTPGGDSTGATLTNGALVEYMGTDSGNTNWYKVRTATGIVGFAHKNHLESYKTKNFSNSLTITLNTWNTAYSGSDNQEEFQIRLYDRNNMKADDDFLQNDIEILDGIDKFRFACTGKNGDGVFTNKYFIDHYFDTDGDTLKMNSGISAKRVSKYYVQVEFRFTLKEAFFQENATVLNNLSSCSYRFVVEDAFGNVARSGAKTDAGTARAWNGKFPHKNTDRMHADGFAISDGGLNTREWPNMFAADDHVGYMLRGEAALEHLAGITHSTTTNSNKKLSNIETYTYKMLNDYDYLYGAAVVWNKGEWVKSTSTECTVDTDCLRLFVNDGTSLPTDDKTNFIMNFYYDVNGKASAHLQGLIYYPVSGGTAMAWHEVNPEGVEVQIVKDGTTTAVDGSGEVYTKYNIEFKIPLAYMMSKLDTGVPAYSDSDIYVCQTPDEAVTSGGKTYAAYSTFTGKVAVYDAEAYAAAKKAGTLSALTPVGVYENGSKFACNYDGNVVVTPFDVPSFELYVTHYTEAPVINAIIGAGKWNYELCHSEIISGNNYRAYHAYGGHLAYYSNFPVFFKQASTESGTITSGNVSTALKTWLDNQGIRYQISDAVSITGWPEDSDMTFTYEQRENTQERVDNFILDGKLEEFHWNTEAERVQVNGGNGYWAQLPATTQQIDYEYKLYTGIEHIYGAFKLHEAAVLNQTKFTVWFNVQNDKTPIGNNVDNLAATHKLEFWLVKNDSKAEDFDFDDSDYAVEWKLTGPDGVEISTIRTRLDDSGVAEHVRACMKTINNETVLEFVMDIDLLNTLNDRDASDGWEEFCTKDANGNYTMNDDVYYIPHYASDVRDGFEYVVSVSHPVGDETLTLYHTGNGEETLWVTGYDFVTRNGEGAIVLPSYFEDANHTSISVNYNYSAFIFEETEIDGVYKVIEAALYNNDSDTTKREAFTLSASNVGANRFAYVMHKDNDKTTYGFHAVDKANADFVPNAYIKFNNLSLDEDVKYSDYAYWDTVPNTVVKGGSGESSIDRYDAGYASLVSYEVVNYNSASNGNDVSGNFTQWPVKSPEVGAMLDYVIEKVEVDGKLDDTGWDKDGWTYVDKDVNANLQVNGYGSANAANDHAYSYKYQVRSDGEYFYVGAVIDAAMGGSNFPYFRIWINSYDERNDGSDGNDYNRVSFSKRYEIISTKGTHSTKTSTATPDFDSRTYLNGWSLGSAMNKAGESDITVTPSASGVSLNYGNVQLKVGKYTYTDSEGNFDNTNPSGGSANPDGLETVTELNYDDSSFYGETKIREESQVRGAGGNDKDPTLLTPAVNGYPEGWVAERMLQEVSYGHEHATMVANPDNSNQSIVEFKIALDEIVDSNGEFEYYFYVGCEDGTEDFVQFYPMVDKEIGNSFSAYDRFYMPFWYWGTTGFTYDADFEQDIWLRSPYTPAANIGAEYVEKYGNTDKAALRLGGYYTQEYIARQMKDYYGDQIDEKYLDGWDYWDVLEMGIILQRSEYMDEELLVLDPYRTTAGSSSTESDNIVNHNKDWNGSGYVDNPADTTYSNFADYETFVYYAVVANIPGGDDLNTKFSYRSYVDYYGNDGLTDIAGFENEAPFEAYIKNTDGTYTLDTSDFASGELAWHLQYYQGVDVNNPKAEGYISYDYMFTGSYWEDFDKDGEEELIRGEAQPVQCYGNIYMKKDAEGNFIKRTGTNSDGVEEMGYVAIYDEFYTPVMTRSCAIANANKITDEKGNTVGYEGDAKHFQYVQSLPAAEKAALNGTSDQAGTTIAYIGAPAISGQTKSLQYTSNGKLVTEYRNFTDPTDYERVQYLAESAGMKLDLIDASTFNFSPASGYTKWVISMNNPSVTPGKVEALAETSNIILTYDSILGIDSTSQCSYGDYFALTEKYSNIKIIQTEGHVNATTGLGDGGSAIGLLGVASMISDIYAGEDNRRVNVHLSVYGGSATRNNDVASWTRSAFEHLGVTENYNNPTALQVLVLADSDATTAATDLIADLADNLAEGIPTVVINLAEGAGTAKAIRMDNGQEDDFENVLLSVPNIGRILGYSAWNTAGDGITPTNLAGPRLSIALGNAISRYAYLEFGKDGKGATAEIQKAANDAFVKNLTYTFGLDIAYQDHFLAESAAVIAARAAKTSNINSDIAAARDNEFRVYADLISSYINVSDIITSIDNGKTETEKINGEIIIGNIEYHHNWNDVKEPFVGGYSDRANFEMFLTDGINYAQEGEVYINTALNPNNTIASGLPVTYYTDSYTGTKLQYPQNVGYELDYTTFNSFSDFIDMKVNLKGDLNDGYVNSTLLGKVLPDVVTSSTLKNGIESGTWFAFIDCRASYSLDEYWPLTVKNNEYVYERVDITDKWYAVNGDKDGDKYYLPNLMARRATALLGRKTGVNANGAPIATDPMTGGTTRIYLEYKDIGTYAFYWTQQIIGEYWNFTGNFTEGDITTYPYDYWWYGGTDVTGMNKDMDGDGDIDSGTWYKQCFLVTGEWFKSWTFDGLTTSMHIHENTVKYPGNEGFSNATAYQDNEWQSQWYGSPNPNDRNGEAYAQHGFGEIVVDLGSEQAVEVLRLHLGSGEDADSWAPNKIEIFAAPKGTGNLSENSYIGNVAWTSVGTIDRTYVLTSENVYWTTAGLGDTETRYLKLRFTLNNGKCYYIDEVEVYGDVDEEKPTESTTLNVATYNVGHMSFVYNKTTETCYTSHWVEGKGYEESNWVGAYTGWIADGTTAPERLGAAMNQSLNDGSVISQFAGLDVICLQEVAQYNQYGNMNQIKLLAEAAGFKYYTYVSAGVAGYGDDFTEYTGDLPNNDMDKPSVGIAIMSKYPIVSARGYQQKSGGSAIAYAEINKNGHVIDIYSVHLTANGSDSGILDNQRMNQYGYINHVLKNRTDYAIVGGDFNERHFDSYGYYTPLKNTVDRDNDNYSANKETNVIYTMLDGSGVYKTPDNILYDSEHLVFNGTPWGNYGKNSDYESNAEGFSDHWLMRQEVIINP